MGGEESNDPVMEYDGGGTNTTDIQDIDDLAIGPHFTQWREKENDPTMEDDDTNAISTKNTNRGYR